MAAQTPHDSEQAALSLTLAIVASSPGPLLLLDGDLNILAVRPISWWSTPSGWSISISRTCAS